MSHGPDRLWPTVRSGPPAGRPLRTRPMAVNFFGPQDRGGRPPANCGLQIPIYCLIWTLAVLPPMAMPYMGLCFMAGQGQCPRPQSG